MNKWHPNETLKNIAAEASAIRAKNAADTITLSITEYEQALKDERNKGIKDCVDDVVKLIFDRNERGLTNGYNALMAVREMLEKKVV